MPAKKKTTKNVMKKEAEPVVAESVAPKAKFNEFGTCIDCQNGVEECLHNNLVENAGVVSCVTCGKCMSCPSE